MEKDQHAEQNLFPSWLRNSTSKELNNDNKVSSHIPYDKQNGNFSSELLNSNSIKFSFRNDSQIFSHTTINNNSLPKFGNGIPYDNYKEDLFGSNKFKINKPLNNVSYGFNGNINQYRPIKKYQSSHNGNSNSSHLSMDFDSNVNGFGNSKNQFEEYENNFGINQNGNNGPYLSNTRKYINHSHSNDSNINKWNAPPISSNSGTNLYNFSHLENNNLKYNDWGKESNPYKSNKFGYNLWHGTSYSPHDVNNPFSPSHYKKNNNTNWRYKEPTYQNGGKWNNFSPSLLNGKDNGNYHSKWRQTDSLNFSAHLSKWDHGGPVKNLEAANKYEPDFTNFDPLSTFLSDDPIILEEKNYSSDTLPNNIHSTHTQLNEVIKGRVEEECESDKSSLTPLGSPQKLSSSLEAEHKLLQAMGWNGSIFENEEPLTEAEVDEFLQKTAQKYGKKFPKNGGVMTLTR